MPKVPAFILRRLYVKNSLANCDTGWRFTLKNSLGSGYAYKMLPLQLDGTEIPTHLCSFKKEGEDITFNEVTKEKTFSLKMNTHIVVSVNAPQLTQGKHSISMGFTVPGFGDMTFDFSDTIDNTDD